ncbi:putative MFS transporter [Aspergillus chevalieri]|uniref:Major facilitator superfamily (MFS) profile domain-containing protein n=1 Tax=Aspergillus chevalieri TaxID=182096 RepID=A0A7R7ZLK7_ASPCH|nr:uncharacterized protein ACHE_21172S [Aspergillus chevalieri]BCR85714.1 hypothetical protein ACHE_21172S [Aspergillus chevalieri]
MLKVFGSRSKQNASGMAEEGCSRNSSMTQLPPEEAQRPQSEYGEPPGTPNTLVQVPSNLTNQDLPPVTDESDDENAEQYKRFSPARKIIIVSIISYCAFLAPISSTAILIAVPEVGKTFGTNGDIINASNALYLAFMGISSTFWGPISQVYGRRPIFVVSSILFCAFTIATTLSPDLAAYFVFRVLTAFQGTSFLVVGSSAVGDIFEQRKRATALVWVLSGSMVGPAIGPFLGGVVVTFRQWRVVFWLLSAMNGFAALLIICFFPETIPYKSSRELKGHTLPKKTKMVLHRISPIRVIVMLFKYPNIFSVGLAAGALVWNQYALLTPIRYILNPRFNLHSPIQSGLFYLVPGAGFLAGSLVGGRWVDYCMKKCVAKRGGVRISEDRLKSSLVHIILIVPGCILIYGWTLEKEVGGIPVPVIAMFVQGVSQLFCMPSLNTYCLDVMHHKGRSAEVVAGNYVFRYVFAALGTGVALPAIEAIGVGWFNTLSALFLSLTGGLIWLTAIYGPKWREAIDAKDEQKAASRKEVS